MSDTRSKVLTDVRAPCERITSTRMSSTDCTKPWVPQAPVTTYAVEHTEKVVTGDCTPGYWEKVKAGIILPVNPFEVATTTLRSFGAPAPHDVVEVSGSRCQVAKATGAFALDPGAVEFLRPHEGDFDMDRIKDSVVTRAAGNARAANFDALTFAAEIRETSNLIGGVLKGCFDLLRGRALRTAYRELQRKYSKRMKNGVLVYEDIPFIELIGLASHYWMQYRYGVMPLAYAAQDAVETLQKRALGITRTDGRGNFTQSLGKTKTVFTPGVGTNPDITEEWTYSGSLIVRGFAIAQSTVPPTLTSGNDFFVTIWELTKLSWMVDWFLQVGDWLQSIQLGGPVLLSPGASEKWQYTSVYTRTYDYGDRVVGGFRHSGKGTHVATLEYKGYKRGPRPLPWMPSWNPSMSPQRWIDLWSLCTQNYLKFYREAEMLRRHHKR